MPSGYASNLASTASGTSGTSAMSRSGIADASRMSTSNVGYSQTGPSTIDQSSNISYQSRASKLSKMDSQVKSKRSRDDN